MEEVLKQIKIYFDPYVKTSLKDWQYIEEDLRVVELFNKSTIKMRGEKEDELRFIIKGAAVKLLKFGDREICYDIIFENEFVSDFYSLLNDKESESYIRNFEPIVYVGINKNQLLKYYSELPLASQIGRIVAEHQVSKLYKKQYFNYGSAKDRYLRIMSMFPDIVKRTPLGYLASYLDVSPQSLSRIRRNVDEE